MENRSSEIDIGIGAGRSVRLRGWTAFMGRFGTGRTGRSRLEVEDKLNSRIRGLYASFERAVGGEARLRDVRYRIEYAAFRAVFDGFRLMPLDSAGAILSTLSREYSVRSRRHRRALANLKRAFPEKTEAEREAIARRMWENVGRVIAEGIHFDTFVAEPHRLDFLDGRILDEYVPDRGVHIVASLHTANWEIGLLLSNRRGYTPAAFYRVVANPYVDKFIKASRETIYSGGLYAVRDESGGRSSAESTSRQFVSCLRKGVPIAILADHHDHDGVLVPFFGQQVRISRVPATLAYQFNARISVARTIRVGCQSRFLAEAKYIDMPRSGDRQADIQAATEAVHRQFENWIRQYPEQWLWSQAPFVLSAEVYRTEQKAAPRD